MIDSRRMPRATPSSTKKPSSSGPRCSMTLHICASTRRCSAGDSLSSGSKNPAIPHIVGFSAYEVCLVRHKGTKRTKEHKENTLVILCVLCVFVAIKALSPFQHNDRVAALRQSERTNPRIKFQLVDGPALQAVAADCRITGVDQIEQRIKLREAGLATKPAQLGIGEPVNRRQSRIFLQA